jgi:hypothetical protein
MKSFLLTAAGLLVAMPLFAQKSKTSPPKATMAEQRECWQQAHAYVKQQNEAMGTNFDTFNPTVKWTYDFSQAHYNPASKICYVEVQHFEVNPSLTEMLWVVLVDDAFEGKNYARFLGGSTLLPDKPPGNCAVAGTPCSWKENSPTLCFVRETKCGSRAEFNGLLWEFIPAFEPVDATTVGKQ